MRAHSDENPERVLARTLVPLVRRRCIDLLKVCSCLCRA